MHNQKKAFTLTELLVVVIVLGVLAAVAVPKFTRVLETRKTTEAEEIFNAVRTEQENRCVFGKEYLTDKSQVSLLAGADNSANYTYSLTEQGIVASSGKGYQLKMLSYKDGQICCEGEYCGNLNKRYPSCSELSVGVDECAAGYFIGDIKDPAGDTVLPNPNPDPEPSSCDDSHKEGSFAGFTSCPSGCGTISQVWHCGADTEYVWSVKTARENCIPKPENETINCNKCGFATIEYTCENNQWKQSIGPCTQETGTCMPGETDPDGGVLCSEASDDMWDQNLEGTLDSPIKTWQSGRTCNLSCQWENNDCSHRGGGNSAPEDNTYSMEFIDSQIGGTVECEFNHIFLPDGTLQINYECHRVTVGD